MMTTDHKMKYKKMESRVQQVRKLINGRYRETKRAAASAPSDPDFRIHPSIVKTYISPGYFYGQGPLLSFFRGTWPSSPFRVFSCFGFTQRLHAVVLLESLWLGPHFFLWTGHTSEWVKLKCRFFPFFSLVTFPFSKLLGGRVFWPRWKQTCLLFGPSSHFIAHARDTCSNFRVAGLSSDEIFIVEKGWYSEASNVQNRLYP